MANQHVNKVVLADGTVLINLTDDTATADKVLEGEYFHLPNGARTQGTCTYDADTSDADASASEILYGKTAYRNGQKITGAMPNIGAQTGFVADAEQPVQIATGYHDGSGTVGIDATEKAKLIPSNIKSGVQILGVTGDYSGDSATAGPVNVTPYLTSQTVLPSSIDKDYISQVNVAAITITETDNSAGGKTVTIGAVDPAA